MTAASMITGEFVYNRLASLFFGLLCLIISAISSVAASKYPFLNYVSIATAILFFFCFIFLLGDFTAHYLIRMSEYFAQKYHKYRLWYWTIFSLILVVIIIVVALQVLDSKKVWEIVFTTLLSSALMIVLYFAKQSYDKYKEKREKNS